MAATTTQLGLVTPTQGDLSGTWGNTVNNGITEYTNIAIAGTLTLTNDGAVTLANTTGDASASFITSTLTGSGTVTAQFAIVRVTGTLTVAKVVTGPSYSKTYTVVNAATGGIVTFKASGQTGVSVAVGESAFVYFNGTDYVKLVGTATAGAAGGSNTQVQFNSSGILSGSSSLTWDGTTLSSTQVNITGQGTLRLQDTTGGEYVGLRSPGTLGASYTLTFPADDGTSGQALITDGSGGLSWSTAASGDVYGPASATDNALARFDGTTGKIIKDSSALTFNGTNTVTLNASAANLTLGISTNYGVVTATGTNPASIYFNGGSRTSFESHLQYFGANHTFFNETGGSEIMRLLNTGNVGIGTSSPRTKLDVNGNAIVGGYPTSTNYAALNVRTSATITTPSTLTNAINIWNGTNVGEYSNITFGYNTTTLTNAPAYMGFVSTSASGGGKGALVFGTRDVTTDTAADERMRLDSAGNLGLGVTPSAWGNTFKAFDIGAGGTIAGNTDLYLGSNIYYNGTNYIRKAIGYAPLYIPSASTGEHQWFTSATSSAGSTISFTQAMTLDASGRLMVGTTTPLDIATIVMSGSTNGNGLTVRAANASGAGSQPGIVFASSAGVIAGQVFADVGGSSLYLNNGSGGSTVFLRNSTESARFDSSGNFGIGTSSPSSFGKLAVRGFVNGVGVNASTFNNVSFETSDAVNSSFYVQHASSIVNLLSDGAMGFYTAISGTVAERARIDSSGNFIVGGTSPFASDTGRGNISINGASTSILGFGVNNLMVGYLFHDGTNMNLFNDKNGYLRFATNGTERARITAAGNLAVGKTVAEESQASGSGYGFNVDGGNGPYFSIVQTSSSTGNACIYLNRKASSGSMQVFQYDNTVVGSITHTSSATAYNTTSDQRLKENIVDAPDFGSVIDSIQVRSFDWKANNEHQRAGFIAQELVTVAPEAVHQPTDTEQMMAVDYSKLVPMLVKEIQSLRTRVLQLETN